MTNDTKNSAKNSNVFKYDCNVCIFKTDDKKEFSEHIGWEVHRVTAMKKLEENL